MKRSWSRHVLPAVTAVAIAASASASAQQAKPPASPDGSRQRAEPQMDPERARALYVSKDPADHARGYDYKRDIDEKAEADARYAKASLGVMDFQKVTSAAR